MNNNYIEQKKKSFLCFLAGGVKYAINTDNVLEIMKLPALDYPQKLPNSIVGLLKYNNFVINIIDIRFYLDIDVEPYNINNELLIVKTDEVIFGIVADKVTGLSSFDSANIDPMPFIDKRMIIDSLYKHNNETIFTINIYSIGNLLKQHEADFTDVDIHSLFPSDECSLTIMRERTAMLTEKSALRLESSELHAQNKYISFNLNDDYYCISLDYVKEVLKDSTITRVPGTPVFIEGIMNLRGDYITVINLKKFLDITDTTQPENDKKPVIIIECNDLKLGLLTDRINELFEFQESKVDEISDSYYASEFVCKKTLYTLLNMDKISSDKRIIVTEI